MDTIKRYYFITLSLFPLLQFLLLKFFNRGFILVYGAFGTLLFLIYLFSGVKLKYPKYILPLFFLVVYYFIWDLYNDTVFTTDFGLFSYLYSDLWLHSVTFLILVENTRFDTKLIQSIIKVFKVTIVLAFLVSIVQLVFNPYFFAPDVLRSISLSGSQYNMRLPSIFGYIGPAELGFSFISIISILIGYYLYKKVHFSFIWIAMAGLVFFASKSRWVYLNFIIILIQYPLVNGINVNRLVKVGRLVIVAVIALLFVMYIAGFDYNVFIEERLMSNSASTRFLAVDMFSQFFPDNPFFGSGVHVGDDLLRALARRSSQIHIGYLSHLYQYGIIGSLFLFSFLFMVLKRFNSTARNTKYYGSLFAIIAVLVANLTLVNFSIFSYGLLFTFIFNRYIDDQHSLENLNEAT